MSNIDKEEITTDESHKLADILVSGIIKSVKRDHERGIPGVVIETEIGERVRIWPSQEGGLHLRFQTIRLDIDNGKIE